MHCYSYNNEIKCVRNGHDQSYNLTDGVNLHPQPFMTTAFLISTVSKLYVPWKFPNIE